MPVLPVEAHGNAPLLEIILNLFDGIGAVVDHGGDERGVGPACGQHLVEMLGRARAPEAMTGMDTASEIIFVRVSS